MILSRAWLPGMRQQWSRSGLASFFLIAILASFWLPASAGAQDGYRLGSGDRVRVIVFGETDMTGEYQIDGKGKLAFPLIGVVDAGGLTATELEKAIADKLSPDYLKDPSVSVEVMTYRPFYIVGEVQKPGAYPYVAGMTILNGVAMAGGFTYRAREGDFYIERGGQGEKVDAGPNTEVQPGDVITVRERWF
jgi:polysaccharide export outer membrane protein